MKEHLQKHYQFYLLLFLWLVVGRINDIAGLVVVAFSFILFRYREMYIYLLFGFWFLLVLSDNYSYGFAATFKPIWLIGLTAFLILDSKTFQPYNKFYTVFAAFMILAIALVLRAPDVSQSFQKALSFSLLLVTIPNYVMLAYRRYKDEFIKTMVWVGCFVLLLGLISIVLTPGAAFRVGRFNGIFGNPNGLGLFCAIFFVVFWVVRTVKPALFSIQEFYIVIILIAISVLLSGSRNAILSIGIMLLFYYLQAFNPFLSIISLIMVVVLYEFTMSNLPAIISALGLEEYFRAESLEDASGRLIAWQFAWTQIQEKYFLGGGFAYVEHVFYDPINMYKLNMMGHQGNIHNSYLTFWMNTGIVGVLLFFGALLYRFVEAIKRHNIMLAALLTILFSINFESWLAASLNPFTIQVVILLTIMIYIPFNEREEEHTVSIF